MYAIIKEILRINENLDIGGVRDPLEPVRGDADRKVAAEAAEMIRKAREEFL